MRIDTIILGVLFAIGAFVTVMVACNDDSDSKQREQQEVLLRQGTDAIGMPAIVNFAERRKAKEILELRDHPMPTYTYIVDMGGHFHFLCNSMGYPLPYSTQLTNPQKYYMQGVTLPQADPNGLFSPAAAEGTWVTCLDPNTKKEAVLYVESRITVSPFQLPAAN